MLGQKSMSYEYVRLRNDPPTAPVFGPSNFYTVNILELFVLIQFKKVIK
jgi:hypothetical protein